MSGTRVVTFGCRLNLAESEAIRAQAEIDGVTNAVVFNTCAVTEEAVRQARQAIRKARREEPGARLIVTGCAAQIEPGKFAAMPEVDLVLGNAQKAQSGALMGNQRVNAVCNRSNAAGVSRCHRASTAAKFEPSPASLAPEARGAGAAIATWSKT